MMFLKGRMLNIAELLTFCTFLDVLNIVCLDCWQYYLTCITLLATPLPPMWIVEIPLCTSSVTCYV